MSWCDFQKLYYYSSRSTFSMKIWYEYYMNLLFKFNELGLLIIRFKQYILKSARYSMNITTTYHCKKILLSVSFIFTVCQLINHIYNNLIMLVIVLCEFFLNKFDILHHSKLFIFQSFRFRFLILIVNYMFAFARCKLFLKNRYILLHHLRSSVS